MTRKNASLCGDIFMGLGLVVMLLGCAGAVLSHLPQLNLSPVVASGAVLGILVGAILWLAGARIGARESINDRYWWIRHFDKRCRRNEH